MMNKTLSLSQNGAFLIDKIRLKQEEIIHWLNSWENTNELPIYSSVDIRNSGFKMAVVDTNIFPAGFNNLCEHGLNDSVSSFREAVFKRSPSCREILIVAEEHTRNTWYLENVRILKWIIEQAGFTVKIATFLSIQPSFCENADFIQLSTATGHPVNIYCFKKILSDYSRGKLNFDLIIMNNDLTSGIPDTLKESKIPIYPSIQAGWHSRLKSYHFNFTNILVKEFSNILGVDPWTFSCIFSVVDKIDINKEEDRRRLRDEAQIVFSKIRQKYQEHNIDEQPYVLIKSDSGTYGMGVMPIEDPDEIIHLNRKNRNKLYKGKSAKVIDRYLIQEGVPTIYNLNNEVSEACIYQIENNLVGGFYRSHSSKGYKDNLNSKGMAFKKMCPHSSAYGDCGVHHDVNIFDIYRILARIAAIAASREIVLLESKIKF